MEPFYLLPHQPNGKDLNYVNDNNLSLVTLCCPGAKVPSSWVHPTCTLLLKHPMVLLSQSPVNQALMANVFILRRYYHKYFKLTRGKVSKITVLKNT